jgi:hypothetical protein
MLKETVTIAGNVNHGFRVNIFQISSNKKKNSAETCLLLGNQVIGSLFPIQ